MKRILHGGPDLQRAYAAAEMNGNDIAQENAWRDAKDLSYGALVQKYGREAAAKTAGLPALSTKLFDDLTMERSTAESVTDPLLDAGVGLANSAISLAGLAGELSPLDPLIDAVGLPSTGIMAAKTSEWISENLRGLQSTSMQRERDVRGLFDELNDADSKAQYDRDVAELKEGDWMGHSVAAISRFGRDIGNSISNTLGSGQMATSVIAEGTGSLLPSVKAAQFAQWAAKGGSALMQKMAVPLAVGVTESSGAFNETINKVIGMSEKELMSSSEMYRALREQGFDHTKAAEDTAIASGLLAAGVNLPFAMAGGKLAEKFEVAPLSPGSFFGAFTNIGKETVEEAVQGASSALSSNVGIQAFADENQDLGEGVGRASGQGVVGGFGMATTLQGPGALINGAAKATVGAGNAVGGFLDRATERAEARAEASSRVSAPVVQKAAERLSGSVGALAAAAENVSAATESVLGDETMENPVGVPDERDEEEKPDLNAIVQRINTAVTFSPDELRSAPPAVAKIFEKDMAEDNVASFEDYGRLDRAPVVIGILEKAFKGDLSKEEQQEAALWAYSEMSKLEGLLQEDLSPFGDDGARIKDDIQSDLDTIRSSPLMKKSAQVAENATIETVPNLTPETLQTPEVQRVIQNTIAVAQVNPIGTNPEANDFILNQIDDGNLDLPPLIKAAVKAAADLRRASDNAKAAKEGLVEEAIEAGAVASNLREKIDMVREDIRDGEREGDSGQFSLNSYVSNISRDATQNPKRAQALLDRLRNFAVHFENKVEAYGKSADLKRAKDNRVSFRGWTGTRWREASEKGAYNAYLNPYSPNGVFLARAVAEDAKLLRDTYNSLLESYGEALEGEKLPPLVLHPIMSMAVLKRGEDFVRPNTDVAVKDEAKPEAKKEEAPKEEMKQEPQAQEEQAPVEEDTAPDEDTNGEEAAGGNAQIEDQTASTQEGEEAGQNEDAGSQDQAEDEAQKRATEDEDRAQDGIQSESDTEATPRARPVPRITVKPKQPAIVRLFNHLKRDPKSGRNLFLESHQVDTSKGLLLEEASPLQSMLAALSDIVDFAKQSGVGYYVDQTYGETFQKLIQTHGQHMIDGMHDLLNEVVIDPKTGKPAIDKKTGKPVGSFRTRITAGGDQLLHKNGRIFNLLDPETQGFNPRLMESAVIAAIHWAMTATGSLSMNREDVAKALDKGEHEVTNKQMRIINNSIQEVRAAENLAKTILEFWGAKVRTDVPMNEALGIAQHLAGELIALMDGRLVQFTPLEVTVKGQKKPKVISYVAPQTYGSQAEEAAIKRMGQAKNFLRDVSVKTDEPDFFFDKKPKSVQKIQKRNPLGWVSDKIQKALSRHQEVAFMRNGTFVDAMLDLDYEALKELSGYQELDPERMNIAHLESIKGLNNSIDHALEGVLRHEAQLQEYASTAQKDPNKVKTFFDWYQGLNGRIMAKGFTGQSIKWMREAFTPTVAYLDLRPGVSTSDHDKFWVTVAQAFGVKTERMWRPDANKKAQALAEIMQPTIDDMKAWLQSPEDNHIRKDVLKASLEDAGIPFSPRVLNALLSVARYQLIHEIGDDDQLANFEHMLSLEADGVTDGPVNAMMHFIAGLFTPEQLENLSRGGVFLGSIGKTLNDFYQGGARKDDIYQTASDALKAAASMVIQDIFNRNGSFDRGNLHKDPFQQAKALSRILGHFGGFEFDEKGRLVFGRGVMKNPLTISVYGSSIDGIMSKLAAAIADEVYADLTDMARMEAGLPRLDGKAYENPRFLDYPQLYDDLAVLTNRRFILGKESWFSARGLEGEKITESQYMARFDQTLKALANPTKFEFSAQHMEILKANLTTLLGDPMEAAIDTIMGETKQTMDLIMAATQIQGHVFKERFRKTVEDKLKALRDAGELTERQLLSQDVYNQIFEEVSRYAAIVESYDALPGEEQHINLSVKETAEGEEGGWQMYSRIKRRTSLGASLPQPGNVGVAAAPMLTISRGDAQMMINYFASEFMDLRVLQVYDGLEMPADGIEAISGRINEASYRAWLDNPMQSVSDSFANFLRQDASGPLSQISEFDTMVAVAKSLDSQDRTIRRRLGVSSVGPRILDLQEMVAEVLGVEVDTLPKDLTDLKKDQKEEVLSKIGEKLLNEYRGDITKLGRRIEQTAMEIQARKNVIGKVTISVDHMASAEAPYVHEGLMPPEGQELTQFLNELYESELAQLEEANNKKKAAPKVQRASTRMRNLARMYGEPVLNGKVHIVKPADMVTMMRDADMPEETRKLFYSVAPRLGNFTIFVGSRASLNAYRAELLPPEQLGKKRDVGHGLTDVDNNMIFLSNPSPETIIHESIHAALAAMIYDHSSDATLVNQSSRTAIENLYMLMDEFLNMDMSKGATKNDLKNFPDAERDVALLVQMQMRKAVADAVAKYGPERGGKLGRAVALNEFVAWSLSNQNLAGLLGKTRTSSPLVRIVTLVAEAIRKLFGIPERQRTMLEAIRFNSEILFRSENNTNLGMQMSRSSAVEAAQEGASVRLEYIDLNQITDIADEPELKALAKGYYDQLNDALAVISNTGRKRDLARTKAQSSARRALNLFAANNFAFSPNGKILFEQIQASFAAGMQLDPKALVKAQQVYDHVMGQLSWTHFLDDPSTANQFEVERAERQFRSLTGEYGFEKHQGGKNNLLASFLALSQVSPVMRKALNKIDLPKNMGIDTSSVDGFFNSVGRSMIDSLSAVITKTGIKPKETLRTLDILVESLKQVEAEKATEAEVYASGLIDTANGKTVKLLERVGNASWDYAEKGWRTSRAGMKDMHKKMIYAGATALGMALSNDRGEAGAEMALSMVNQNERLPKFISNLFSEVIGVTDQNWGVLRMVNQVRSAVQALRQDYREEIPVLLASKFKRKLKPADWARMHLGLGRTDIAALLQGYSVRDTNRMLKDPSFLAQQIQKLEDKLGQMDAWNQSVYLRKIDELALFMVKGEIDPKNMNLLMNADAIAMLFGEGTLVKSPKKGMVKTIDMLISMKALEMLDQPTKDGLSELAQQEEDGMFFSILYLGDTRAKEVKKARHIEERARYNALKGYIPAERGEGSSLIVADDSKHVDLLMKGYVRVGDYDGIQRGKESYYYSAVSGKSSYQQGILQTVQTSYFGVNALTGYPIGGNTAGIIQGQDLADFLDDVQRGNVRRNNRETVIPIYDEVGNLMAYSRSIMPEQLDRLNRNDHFGEMMGAWAGRQAEEELAQQYNSMLLERLKEMWEQAKADGRTNEYVNLLDRHTDPVLRDSIKMIPTSLKAEAERVFGGEGFMVRRSELENVLGYRLPTVTDLWSGNSRVPESIREPFRKTAIALFGLAGKENKAYTYLATGEKAWQTLVSEAKNTIVVRSVIVPLKNLASNWVQLLALGVPPTVIFKGMMAKLTEIEQYQRLQKMRVDLRGEMARNRTNPDEMRRLNAKMQRLEDAERRMSIWPLIEAGEFSTISEGMTDLDAALTSGKWVEWMKAQSEKLPASLGTAGRYAVLTRDTALFQGMSRATQYGDFLARAVLYDHITKTKKGSKEEALRFINEEFVNYNFLPGRSRSYLESMGVTWFWAFKIRSMKTALRHIRNNPLQSLLLGSGVVDVGLPINDNMAAVALQGGLDNSIGTGMLFRAPELNPWYNLMH